MDNTCIFCGKIIPEGMTVCPICMGKLGGTSMTDPMKEKMSNNEAICKLADHFLGKDWYSYYTNTEDINDEIVYTICKRYRGVDESPVNKWRRKHKRCYFCDNLKLIENPIGSDTFVCDAQAKPVNTDIPPPFCRIFVLRMEKEK